jgi:glutamate synthase (NADPH) small chain
MGKPGGVMEYDRKEPCYRPVEERLKDHREVEIKAGEDEILEQAARCMDCGAPFCHAYGCPVANNIPEFNEFVHRGLWKEALDMLLSTNNFPEFTGRLCPAPCEPACVAGINQDPVSIREIELAVIEKAFETGLMKPSPPERRDGTSAAVIGSGPAGLAAADTLNRAGVRVTVFDQADKLGGLLRYGIPDFKMEKQVIDRRVRLMEDEGVIFETGIVAGEDISLKYLLKHFDAVCLACGARAPRDLPVPGRDLDGVHFAMDYLVQQNVKNRGNAIDPSLAIHARGKKVVVIGGGDTGSDCVGTALRQGAQSVTQLEIMPKPPEERPDETPWPMWPDILRASHAHKEGGERRWSTATQAFEGEFGQVKKLKCVQMEWEAGAPPAPVPGSEFEIEADLVILAMGFTGPGNKRLIEAFNLETDSRGNVKADPHRMTSVDGVFVSGDMTIGQSLIVWAISSGREAAQGILSYLEKDA